MCQPLFDLAAATLCAVFVPTTAEAHGPAPVTEVAAKAVADSSGRADLATPTPAEISGPARREVSRGDTLKGGAAPAAEGARYEAREATRTETTSDIETKEATAWSQASEEADTEQK